MVIYFRARGVKGPWGKPHTPASVYLLAESRMQLAVGAVSDEMVISANKASQEIRGRLPHLAWHPGCWGAVRS